MMRYFPCVLCAFVLGTTPVLAHATKDKPVRCLLQVRQKIYFDGPCIIENHDPIGIGSFAVFGTRKHPSKHFSYVNTNDDGTADGFWNADPADTHAHDPLGVLKHNGKCWENDTAKICLYDQRVPVRAS